MYAVYSATELSPDPDYDVEEGQPWYVQAWNGFKKALADLLQAYEELHRGIKVLIGLALIAAAVLLTIVTYGGFTAAVPALINMALQLGIGIAGGIVMWGVGALLTNGFSLEGLRDALVDGIFWGGVFAFISASVNAVKEAVRAIKGLRSNAAGICCFQAGTPVLTEAGYKPIEEINVGDKVLAYDEETGEREYKEVVRLFRNETRKWCHVYIEGQEEPIVSTPGHPFYVLNTTADRLIVDSKL